MSNGRATDLVLGMIEALLVSQVETQEYCRPAHVREALELVKLDAARRVPHLDIDLSLINHDRLVVHLVLGGSIGL